MTKADKWEHKLHKVLVQNGIYPGAYEEKADVLFEELEILIKTLLQEEREKVIKEVEHILKFEFGQPVYTKLRKRVRAKLKEKETEL